MSFIETRLLDCVTYGTQGGPTWKTRKIGLKNGFVRRNPQRTRPMYRFNIVYRNLMPGDHAKVIDAFNACMGGVFGFRIKDWSDFEADDQVLAAVGSGAPQTVQLIKTYAFGSRAIARKIVKPVTGTVELTSNNVPIASSVDYTTGLVTYTAPNAEVIRWSGQFDVPVTFSDDELMFSGDDKGADGLFLTADVALEEDFSA